MFELLFIMIVVLCVCSVYKGLNEISSSYKVIMSLGD